jgi:hypothetical protein
LWSAGPREAHRPQMTHGDEDPEDHRHLQ